MTTVQTIVAGAYLRSTTFDAGKLALDAELISHLNRVYQRVWPLIARARPDQYSAETTLTLSGVPASATLPASILDILETQDSDGTLVNVIPSGDRQRRWNLAPCVYRIGTTLKSRNDTGDPVGGDILTMVYLDQPTTLDALTDELDTRWPVRHDQLLVDYLATYLAVKDGGMKDGDRAALRSELQQDVAALAYEYQIAPSALNWIHADAERAVA